MKLFFAGHASKKGVLNFCRDVTHALSRYCCTLPSSNSLTHDAALPFLLRHNIYTPLAEYMLWERPSICKAIPSCNESIVLLMHFAVMNSLTGLLTPNLWHIISDQGKYERINLRLNKLLYLSMLKHMWVSATMTQLLAFHLSPVPPFAVSKVINCCLN